MNRRAVLIYRDRLLPSSEVAFMARQYSGFSQLRPVWIGCRRDEGTLPAEHDSYILGGDGAFGDVERALFKQLGRLPSTPDLAALNPGIVHAQFGRGGALALPIAQRLRIPLVVTFHGGDAHKDKHYQRQLLRTVYQRRLPALINYASAFVCVSETVAAKLVERGFPEPKIKIIEIGVDLVEAPASPPAAEPYLLFVGRFVPKKGIETFMAAVAHLRAQGHHQKVVLVGDGPLMDSCRRQAEGLSNVEFAGWKAVEEVRRLMQGAAALCVPSIRAADGDSEGLPSVAVEAMSCGTLVIASDEACLNGVVTNGQTGLVVPARDGEALAAALARSLSDPSVGAMAEAGRQLVLDRLVAEKQSRKLENLLASFIRT